MRRHLSYANVVSTLALCLVVGGGSAYAAAKLTRNSVKAKHIAPGAVASSDIKDRSVALKDLAADVTGRNGEPGLAGAPGPQGPTGPQGPAGKDGAAGQNLAFDGVRLGKFERHEPVGTIQTTPRIPLGEAGPIDLYGRCYTASGALRTTVTAVRKDGSTATGLIYGGTGANGYGGVGPSSYELALLWEQSSPVTTQWAATVVLYTGEAWDVRGAIYRQNDTGPFPPAGDACAFTPAYVERISR